jgi:hypothetical protein
MDKFIGKVINCLAYRDTHIGGFQVRKGDLVTMTERGDGLWNVAINGVRISFAIDGTFVNDLADSKMVEA